MNRTGKGNGIEEGQCSGKRGKLCVCFFYPLSVSVTDNTEFVRDEFARAAFMTESVSWAVTVDPLSSVPGNSPRRVALSRDNAPNPFNPRTSIGFELGKDATVELRIYDLSGKRVRTLLNDSARSAGKHFVTWDGLDDKCTGVSSGTYLYQLKEAQEILIRRMVLVR